MEAPPQLPHSAERALRAQGEDVNWLLRWRIHACARLEAWARELEPERAEWAAALHPDVRAVIGHIHGPHPMFDD